MIITQQVIQPDTKYIVTIPGGLVSLDIHNDSPYNMAFNLGDDSGLGNAEYYMSPHSIMYGINTTSAAPGYSVGGSRSDGQLFVYTQTPLGGAIASNSAPASSLTVAGYPAGRAPQNTVSLNRLANLGNAGGVQVSQTVANQIVDHSNTAGELTYSAAVVNEGDSVQIFNDGNANFGNLTRQGTVKMALGEILAFILHNSPGAKQASILGDSASGELRITNQPSGVTLRLTGGTNDVVLDAVNGALNLQTAPVTVSGSVSGTASLYQILTGTVKITVVECINYKSAAAQTLALPVAYTQGGSHWVADELQGGQVEALAAGVAQTFSVRTALPTSSGGGSQIPLTVLRGWSDGACRTAFDTVRVTSTTNAATCVITIVGS